MGKKYDFDYLIIGSGPAGSTTALTLAKAKKSVGLIEDRAFGGTNLSTRDIPYSVALDFAHVYSRIQSYPALKHQDFHFNLPSVLASELRAIIKIGGNNKALYEKAGITCISGFANLLDHHTVAVKDKKYTAANLILATGSSLKTSSIPSAPFIKHLTPETAIKIRRLPKVMAVVGGGATGCEIAEFYAELGVKTILFENSKRLLPHEDREVGACLAEYFTKKLGITVLTSSRVVALEKDEFSKRVIFRHENVEKLVRVDNIVLATGSQPNLEYGLENAGVKYTKTGITVNKYFETSAKNIYAIGDCIGGNSSTDRAYAEGFTLANNLINKVKNPVNYRGLVRSVKTLPEIAVVGSTEAELLKRGHKYHKAITNLNNTTASELYHFDSGFVKLISDRTNHIIGASIVAPHADLIASEIATAVRHNLTALELASTPHAINSYNYLVKLAAKQLLKKKS